MKNIVWAVVIVAISFGCQSDIKTQVINNFGGEEALEKLGDIRFSVLRKRINGNDTLSKTRYYRLNAREKFLEEIKLINGDTLISVYRNNQGFDKKHQQEIILDEKATHRLYQQLYYNFLYLLKAETDWATLTDTIYNEQKVKVVSVKDRTGKAEEIHLFINDQTYEIISSSIPEKGQYSYYADEYDYEFIPGTRIKFPMRFVVMNNGKASLIGEFKFSPVTP